MYFPYEIFNLKTLIIARHDWGFENNAGESGTKITDMVFVCLPPLPASPHLPNLYAAKCLAHVPVCGEIKKEQKEKGKEKQVCSWHSSADACVCGWPG